MLRSIAWKRALAAASMALGLVVGTAPQASAEAVHLELVETVVDNGWEFSVSPTQLSKVGDKGTQVLLTWTEPPKSFDPSGFKVGITLSAQRPTTGDRDFVQVSGGFGTWDAKIEPSETGPTFNVLDGESYSESKEWRVWLDPGRLTVGQSVTLTFGAVVGNAHASVAYRYQVVSGTGTPAGPITAELVGCPPNITISELPSATCHLKIGGFRHNTADVVEVVLPSAMDLQGNHGNGLQLPQTAGTKDVSLMDDPYMWPVTIFACPGQPGAGVNCNGTAATAQPLTVPITVRQANTGETQVVLGINAVAGPNSVVGTGTGGGEAVTTTPIPAGPGQIGAAADCPGTIYISALPSIHCSLIITGWLKDSAAPVTVDFITADEFGTNVSGLQMTGEGQEDHFSWDNEDSHAWPITIFACPGQSETGANCGDRVTKVGEVIALIEIKQEGLESAMLLFRINALPHP